MSTQLSATTTTAPAASFAADGLLPTTVNAEFRCTGCGHAAPAQYHDPEADAEDNQLLPKPGWARQQALHTAQVTLEKRARKALSLRRCPQCGARDPLALRRSYWMALLPIAAVLPATFMVSVIATVMLLPGPPGQGIALRLPLFVGALCSLIIGAVITPRQHRRLLRGADDAVRIS